MSTPSPRRVYLASPAPLAAGPAPLVARRVLLARPLAALAPPPLPRSYYLYLLVLCLADALGCLLGIDLVGITFFSEELPRLAVSDLSSAAVPNTFTYCCYEKPF